MFRFLLIALILIGSIESIQAQNSSAGLTPSPVGRTISVTSTSSSIQVGPSGVTVVVWNTGAVDAYFAIGGGSSAPTATTANPILPAGGVIVLNIPPNGYLAARTSASTTTLQITQGQGATSVAWSGATGGGTGTVVTQGTSPWIVAGGGTAGTAATGVVTVQGITGMTPIATTASGTANVTPTDCSGTITTGGTAQNAHTAQSTLRGMTIANLDTTEVMWISFTTTAAPSTVASYPLAPASATTFAGLSSYTTPLGFGYNTALSVVAATTGHKWSCTRW